MISSKKEVLVFGSGVSGLVAAYYLNKKNFKVFIVDPFNKPILQTLRVKEGIVELAANSILLNEKVKDLLEDLNLEYYFYNPVGKRKFFFRKNKITRWPLSFFQSLMLFPFFIKFIFFKSSLLPKRGERLKLWANRCLPQKFYERIFKRSLQGVYGPGVDELSASLVLKFLLNAKIKSFGSISFKEGMSVLPETLKSHLKENGVSFLKKEPKAFNGIRIISTPTHSLPDSISESHKSILSKVLYHNISTLTIFVREEDRASFSGFGLVFEDVKGVLGLILNSDLFSNRAKSGFVSETWILDGRVFSAKNEALRAVLSLRKRMNKKNIEDASVQSYHFKNWSKAFPIYDLNLEKALEKLQPEKDVFYFANWTGSLGIGKMIAKGEEFANSIEKKQCNG